MRFLETLFRHRLLAILPIVLGLIIAMGYELSQPRAYQTSASLWIDSNVPGATTTQNSNQYVDPSTQQQSIIDELLTTRSFALAVGHHGPLAAYLASHPNADVKGIAAVPGIGVLFSSNGKSVDNRIASDLPSDVTVSAPGPQVVTITVRGPSPEVVAGTTDQVVKEYMNQVVAALRASDQTAVSYYAQQAAQAQKAMQDADAALDAYLKTHPGVPIDGGSDPAASQLSQTATLAQRNYGTQLAQYQQAQLNLANAGNYSGFQEIDGPSTPSAPISRVKNVIVTGIGGVVVGAVVMLLIMGVLTAMDGTVRRPADVKRQLGLDVVAGIDSFRTTGAVKPS